MLKNIKSSFFMKFLFNHIRDQRKLLLLRYNKKLQKIIEVNLINYIFFSGRYIIYEKKGKVKEYRGNNNTLIFEGEYLNWKRNGKRKEYNLKVDIIFEGVYKNGKKNGYGKEYDYKDRLIYEGEYLDDKRYNWKMYDSNGKIINELNGLNGNGKEYSHRGDLMFEGEIKMGKEMGMGKNITLDIHIKKN